jgi:predicted XRE-type DNA-binding protein
VPCARQLKQIPYISSLIQIQKLIATHGLKQRAAATTLGVRQPRVSDFLRGGIDLFKTDAFIDILARFGATVRLTVKVLRAACVVFVGICQYAGRLPFLITLFVSFT